MDKQNASVCRPVTVWDGAAVRTDVRELVEEIRCPVWLNGRQAGMLSCSPWDVEEAALGYLYTSGLLERDAVVECAVLDECVRVTAAPAEKREENPVPSLRLTAEQVAALAHELEQRSDLFRRTGGVHCAAVSRGEGLLVYREDVSRHVAVDKVAGACLLRGISTEGAALVFSGRVPGEILAKAAAMGCSAIIARSAPTDHACRMAEQLGIALIAFAREGAFTVYTCPDRICF